MESSKKIFKMYVIIMGERKGLSESKTQREREREREKERGGGERERH